jgi:hypothetical protein
MSKFTGYKFLPYMIKQTINLIIYDKTKDITPLYTAI